MNLEYFIAALPTLALDHPAPLTTEAFRALCETQLDAHLGGAAAALLDGTAHPHPYVVAWRDRETILRNAVVRRRAARLGTDAQVAIRPAHGSDLQIEHAVAAAFEQPDPWQREQALDRLRWRVLEELQGPQPMAPEAVLAFAVKLRLVEARGRLDAGAGRERLERLATLPAPRAKRDTDGSGR